MLCCRATLLAGLARGDGPPAVSCSLLGLGAVFCVWVGSLSRIPVWTRPEAVSDVWVGL